MYRLANIDPIALAISGGVDSMALAYLFSEFHQMFPGYKLGDYPTQLPCAIIVNHNLRHESEEEALMVARQCRKLGLKSMVRNMRWRDLRKMGLEPSEMENIESLARSQRYHWLGLSCRGLMSPFLFTAHHQDDQYETVLMRLLNGHGYRGLRGIRAANDIPESHGMYAVHKSGLLQDQKSRDPYIKFRPSVRQTRMLRRIFREEKGQESDNLMEAWASLDDLHFHHGVAPVQDASIPLLKPLDSEDGGVTVYRPLLEFDKDSLRATCEANKIEWFEDSTNKNQTLTMRNAVRHMAKHHTLPEALQKPAILSLCKRSQRRTDLEEAEARRLIIREAVVQSFDPCAGTLIISFPPFKPNKKGSGRFHHPARNEARKPHQRLIAALAIRQLMDFVTPEKHLPPPSNLSNFVNIFFPELDSNHESAAKRPTAFSLGGILFEPIIGSKSVMWYLSRAPFKNRAQLPDVFVDWREERVKPLKKKEDHGSHPGKLEQRHHGWRTMEPPKHWDGRFWISLASRVHDRFHVRPYYHEHASAFKASLPERERAHLEKSLKHYAPGKVRTTLPALYRAETETVRDRVDRHHLTMLALPTFSIQVEGLDKWVQYDVSYKKWDKSLTGLEKRGTPKRLAGYRPSFSRSRARRTMRLRNRSVGRRPHGDCTNIVG